MMNNNQIDKLFFGQRVVFVGKFKKIKKNAAVEYILKNIGVINKKVSWNTNIVIVGEVSQENQNLIKLNELIYSAGRGIKRMSEDDFLCHIEEVSLTEKSCQRVLHPFFRLIV
jgi:NAD-dependent DNA ligase